MLTSIANIIKITPSKLGHAPGFLDSGDQVQETEDAGDKLAALGRGVLHNDIVEMQESLGQTAASPTTMVVTTRNATHEKR